MYSARHYLLAEYCGIPSSKRAERPVCMLKGYFDDSREDGCVLILAGYVASVEQWLSFSERWDQALTMNSPRWQAFKMRKVDLNDPFQLERAEYHYRIIEEFLPGGLCVAIPIPIFTKVVEKYNLEQKFRNPYYLGWNLVVSTFRNFHVYHGWKQTIDVCFDKQGESKMVLQAWDIISQKEGMGPFKNAPMFRDDEEIVALQAADLLAWWARKNWVEHGSFHNKSWLFPWKKREIGPDYMFSEMNEDNIRQHFLNTMISPNRLAGEAE